MKQISTTTFIAVLCIILCFATFIVMLLGLAKCSAELQSQITQINYAIIMLILGFFYGASHTKKELTKTDNNDIKQTTMTTNE